MKTFLLYLLILSSVLIIISLCTGYVQLCFIAFSVFMLSAFMLVVDGSAKRFKA